MNASLTRAGIVTPLLLLGVACASPGSNGNAGVDLVGDASASDPPLLWYTTCGDPVCQVGRHQDHGLPRCTVETAGKGCGTPGASCDLMSDCNELLLCSTKDPKEQVGGCPISRMSHKKDIRYLSTSDLESYRDQLLALPLATYRYRQASPGSRLHLGFMIDGHESLVCVEPERDQVDLYGYTSMAVATLQIQARQIDALAKELAALRAEMETQKSTASPPPHRLR